MYLALKFKYQPGPLKAEW